MAVEYRLMRAEEAPAVIRFWSQGSDMSEAYQAARFASDPDACAHTCVAVLPDGTIASTIHYRVSCRCDATGLPRRVGEVDSVGTRPDARRQGHAEHLLLLVLAALERDGCDWSLLVATDMGRPLYERHGWRCYPEPWRRGIVTNDVPLTSDAYLVRPFDPFSEPDGWERIAAVDMAFNHKRPLTVVRDPAYWRHDAALRVGHWITTEGMMIFAAFRSEADPQIYGYAMGEFIPVAFQIRDLGVLPTETAAIPALLNAVTQEARRRGIPLAGRMFLPHEPSIDAALDQLFGATLERGQNQGQLMARTIGSQFTNRQLDALFEAPGAIFSCIDIF
jgi:GNAT superfamily N-acetyltransferase